MRNLIILILFAVQIAFGQTASPTITWSGAPEFTLTISETAYFVIDEPYQFPYPPPHPLVSSSMRQQLENGLLGTATRRYYVERTGSAPINGYVILTLTVENPNPTSYYYWEVEDAFRRGTWTTLEGNTYTAIDRIGHHTNRRNEWSRNFRVTEIMADGETTTTPVTYDFIDYPPTLQRFRHYFLTNWGYATNGNSWVFRVEIEDDNELQANHNILLYDNGELVSADRYSYRRGGSYSQNTDDYVIILNHPIRGGTSNFHIEITDGSGVVRRSESISLNVPGILSGTLNIGRLIWDSRFEEQNNWANGAMGPGYEYTIENRLTGMTHSISSSDSWPPNNGYDLSFENIPIGEYRVRARFATEGQPFGQEANVIAESDWFFHGYNAASRGISSRSPSMSPDLENTAVVVFSRRSSDRRVNTSPQNVRISGHGTTAVPHGVRQDRYGGTRYWYLPSNNNEVTLSVVGLSDIDDHDPNISTTFRLTPGVHEFGYFFSRTNGFRFERLDQN